MSILGEYEDIKREVGEELFLKLTSYLSFHPHKLLSDLYYNKDEWDIAIDWYDKTPDCIKNNVPLYLIVENYKGLCEHNFFGTKKEIIKDLGITESEFDRLFYPMDSNNPERLSVKEEIPTFYKKANLSYEIRVGKSIEDLIGFFKGKFNDKEAYIENPDWYYSLHESRCGTDGLKILSTYKEENENLKILTKALFMELKKEEMEGKIFVKYEEYLNHKPILKCASKRDIEQHDHDNDQMFFVLSKNRASAALITEIRMDAAKKGETSYHLVPVESFREHLDGYDQKNGMDFVIHEGKVGVVIYGGNYTYGEEKSPGMEEVLVTYQLLDDKKIDLLNLKEELDNTDRSKDVQKILSCIAKEDVFLQDETLKEVLRDVKRLPLDVQIKNSEKIKKEQQEKKRGKEHKSRDRPKQSERE